MFIRSLLTVSLLAQLSGTALAADATHLTDQQAARIMTESSTERPLVVKKVADLTEGVEDPFDPLAVDATTTPLEPVDQQDIRDIGQGFSNSVPTEQGLDKIESTEASHTSAPPVAAKWDLNGLNSADWYDNIGRGQFPVYARAHVLLNNAHASPGAIDGTSGKNTQKAILTFQTIHGLERTGSLDKATWDALIAKHPEDAYMEYTITAQDLKGPFLPSIPANYAEQAKLPGLYYTRVSEALAEKFHMDEAFLKKLNPNAKFKAGEKLIVANVKNDLPENIHYIVAHKGVKQLYLFNSSWKMIGSFPASIGSTETPSPTGKYRITGVAKNPPYSYSPTNFVQGGNLKPLTLPPGPNGPVGNIWIALSKRSFGIHGTPNPSMISKSFSHGCIRLTNWDANDLGRKVKAGVEVMFIE